METIAIKEVYEQLEKDELGKDRAKIAIEGIEYVVLCLAIHEVLMMNPTTSDLCGVPFDTQVEWIGNQPKKKMLYAYWAFVGGNREILLAEKKGSNVDCLEWMPEDKYPPFEIEVK